MSRTHLSEPSRCTIAEREEFERLVRRGFNGSDDGLPGRIRGARWLAFHHAMDGKIAAIAGLKALGEAYRIDTFTKAGTSADVEDFALELGWVFVLPEYRGAGLGMSLCQELLALVPTSHVYATTRPTNSQMTRILRALGFARAGTPFQRRDEELVLFLRPAQSSSDG